jgi:PAS domain-containing protein
MEARLRRGSGEYRLFLVRMGLSRNDRGEIIKWYGTAKDIEQLKRMDSLSAAEKMKMIDQIRGSEAQLRRVIDTIPTLACRFLQEGSNEFMNKRWHEYTGLTR